MNHRVYSLVAIAVVTACLSGCDYFVSAETRVERARTYIDAGDRRAAVVELKNALQKNPDLYEARIMLADAALWLGDVESAEAQLQRVPADFASDHAEDLRIRIALGLNRLEQVKTHVARPQSQLTPARRDMYLGHALLQGRQDLEKARRAFESAIAHDSTLIGARIGLIETLHQQGLRREALDAARQLMQQHPDSAEASFAYAQAAVHASPQEALSALERARGLAPRRLDMRRHVMLLTALVEQQLVAGKQAEAHETAAQLSQLAPGSPLATLVWSRVSMAANDYAAATAQLRRLVNASPEFAQARFMLGAALAAQGSLEQAAQELQQVLDQAPQFLEARQLLAQVKMRLEDPDGALQVLLPGLGSEAVAADYLALVDAARGGSAEGATIERLEKAVARDPSNRGLVRQLGSAYLHSGAAPQALKLLRNAAHEPLEPQQEALLLHAILEVEGAAAAKVYAQSLVERHGAEPKAVSLVAALYARLGDVAAARRLVEAQLGASRDDPELLLTLARINWAARDPARALEVLRELSAEHPRFTAGRIALAEAELARGDRAAARTQLHAVRTNEPTAAAPRMMLARLALLDQDVASAEAFIDEARKGADVATIEGAAGLMYLSFGRYDQAAAHLRSALTIDAGVAPWWLHLGRAQMALDQHPAARESFERALSIRPRWTAAEGALAFLDMQQGASDAATQRVSALRAAKPHDVEAIALDAQVQYALRRYTHAARAFDDAIALRPSAAFAIGAYEARRAANEPDATEPLEAWLSAHPEDATVRFALAEAYLHQGQREQAAAAYRAVAAANPRNAAALNNLAWVYFELNDARAEETALRAIAAAPKSPEVSDTLGWILVERGRIEEGLAMLERAATGAPRNPDIVYHYAAALIRSGATERGKSRLRELLEDHSDFASRAEAERLLRGS